MGLDIEHAVRLVRAMVISASGIADIDTSPMMQASIGWTLVEYHSD